MRSLKHRHGRKKSKNMSLKGGIKRSYFDKIKEDFDKNEIKNNGNETLFVTKIKTQNHLLNADQQPSAKMFNNSIYLNTIIKESIQEGITYFDLKNFTRERNVKTDIQVSEYKDFLIKIKDKIETLGYNTKENIFYYKILFLISLFDKTNVEQNSIAIFNNLFNDGKYIQYIYDIGLGNTVVFNNQHFLSTNEFENTETEKYKNNKHISEQYYEFMFKQIIPDNDYYSQIVKTKFNENNRLYETYLPQIKPIIDKYDTLFNKCLNLFKTLQPLGKIMQEYKQELTNLNEQLTKVVVDINESIYPGTIKMMDFCANKIQKVKLQYSDLIDATYINNTPTNLIGTINCDENGFTFLEVGEDKKVERINPTRFINIIPIDEAEIIHLQEQEEEKVAAAALQEETNEKVQTLTSELEKLKSETKCPETRVVMGKQNLMPNELSISFNKKYFQKNIVSNLGNIFNSIGLLETLLLKLNEKDVSLTDILSEIKSAKNAFIECYTELAKILGFSELNVSLSEPDSLARGAMQANMASYLLATLFFAGLAGGSNPKTINNFTSTLKGKKGKPNKNKSNKMKMKGGELSAAEIAQIPALAVNINKDIIQQIYLNIELLKHLKENTKILITNMSKFQDLYTIICSKYTNIVCETPDKFFNKLTSIFIPVSKSDLNVDSNSDLIVEPEPVSASIVVDTASNSIVEPVSNSDLNVVSNSDLNVVPEPVSPIVAPISAFNASSASAPAPTKVPDSENPNVETKLDFSKANIIYIVMKAKKDFKQFEKDKEYVAIITRENTGQINIMIYLKTKGERIFMSYDDVKDNITFVIGNKDRINKWIDSFMNTNNNPQSTDTNYNYTEDAAGLSYLKET